MKLLGCLFITHPLMTILATIGILILFVEGGGKTAPENWVLLFILLLGSTILQNIIFVFSAHFTMGLEWNRIVKGILLAGLILLLAGLSVQLFTSGIAGERSLFFFFIIYFIAELLLIHWVTKLLQV